MKRRIIAILCAMCALSAAALPSVYAEETVTVTTLVNGSGVITTYEDGEVTTNTYTAEPTAAPEAQTEDGGDEAEISASEAALYESYLFRAIKKFVFLCMDEYNTGYSHSDVTPIEIPTAAPEATAAPEDTSAPTAAPSPTATPSSTGIPSSTATPSSTGTPSPTVAPVPAQE